MCIRDSDKEKQDIAIIGIEKTGNESATLQIEGDADLYAENTFVEPNEVVESSTGGKGGPSVSELYTKQAVSYTHLDVYKRQI